MWFLWVGCFWPKTVYTRYFSFWMIMNVFKAYLEIIDTYIHAHVHTHTQTHTHTHIHWYTHILSYCSLMWMYASISSPISSYGPEAQFWNNFLRKKYNFCCADLQVWWIFGYKREFTWYLHQCSGQHLYMTIWQRAFVDIITSKNIWKYKCMRINRKIK